jgi:hypothetical protein
VPSAHTGAPAPRDRLSRFCFGVHVAVMVYVLLGWTIAPGLIIYLIFLPAMALHWQINRGSCLLNNCESLIRSGQWRNAANREEGAWLRCVISDLSGLALAPRQIDAVSYALLALLWGLGWWHWAGWL